MSETITHQPKPEEIKKFQEESKGQHPYEKFNEGYDNPEGIPTTNGVPDYIRFFETPANTKTTEELLEQQAKLETLLKRDNLHPRRRAEIGARRQMIESQLLYRSNPEYHKLRDKWSEISNKHADDFRKWDRELSEKEGVRAVNKKLISYQIPDFYTTEELDLYIGLKKNGS